MKCNSGSILMREFRGKQHREVAAADAKMQRYLPSSVGSGVHISARLFTGSHVDQQSATNHKFVSSLPRLNSLASSELD